jgi:hypothetical protein
MANVANARVCGRFVLREKIGAGGFGEVWRAHDEVREADVALKILYPQLHRSDAAWRVLEREFTLASRLNHPGVLRVYEPMRDEQHAVLPMSFAPGGDLRGMRGQPYTRIVPLLIEVARALEHAHARGVIHRDLKSGNVLLDPSGRALLADFGAAASAGDPEGVAPGSPFTTSPQQLDGEPPAQADDVYGLGALAYELLSGAPPYYPNFDLQRVRTEPVPPLAAAHDVPPRLTQLVMRMLAKQPGARPATMHDVVHELQSVLQDTLTFPSHTLPAADDDAEADDVGDYEVEVDEVLTATPVATHAPDAAAALGKGATPPRGEPELPPIDIWNLDQVGDRPIPRIEEVAVSRTKKPEVRRSGWWLALGGLVAAGVVLLALLPRFAAAPSAPAVVTPPQDQAVELGQAARDAATFRERFAQLTEESATLAKRVAALDQRAAAQWGGEAFAAAKSGAAEAEAALARDDLDAAQSAVEAGLKQVAALESEAPRALEAQLAAGDRALVAVDVAVAKQAYETAQRISPNNERARAGLAQLEKLNAVAPLLARAETAAAAGDAAQAKQLFEQVLAQAPGNAAARAGLNKLQAEAGADAFSSAMGAAIAALDAGRTADARAALERARTLRPNDAQVEAAFARLDAAQRGGSDTELEQRARRLVAEERWTEALAIYDQALARDPSLAFAQRGRALALPRAELSRRLQGLIERPERMGAPSVRAEADRLLARARALPEQGPVVRSQIARLEMLLPEFDRTVRLSLESDNATEVAIQRVGFFGAFERREVELKPGQYTIIGRRPGFRDVRREFTVAPGADQQTIIVRCIEPI